MKYQTITVSTDQIAQHITGSNTIGTDRLAYAAQFPGTGYRLFVENAVSTGDLDQYWGPLDSVVFNEGTKTVTTTFNTLAGAENWYKLIIREDNLPHEHYTLSCQIVKIEDDGTFVEEVRKSD